VAAPPPVVDERFAKFDKMRKMLPEGAVRQKMAGEGFTPAEIDGFFSGASSVASPTLGTSVSAPTTTSAAAPAVKKPAAAPAPVVPAGPVKPKVKTRVKMRDLFWNPIPDASAKESRWAELDDNSIKLDLDTFDSLFGEKEKEKDEKKEEKKKDENKVVKEKKELITDGKRQQNVNIAISRLRMSYEDLKLSILKVDETILDENLIQTLLKIVPTAEEIEIVTSYDGDKNMLTDLCKFFIVMGTIPKLEQRLKSMLYKVTFKNIQKDLDDQMKTVSLAVKEIDSSKKLKKLLEIILAIGNYINGEGKRGGAWGFKIDTFEKIAAHKAGDGKTTVMHYLVNYLEKNFPDHIHILAEWSNAAKCQTIMFQDVESQFKQLKNGMKMIDKQSQEAPTSDVDNFSKIMSTFCKSNEVLLENMSTQLTSTQSAYEKLVQGYLEDPKKLVSEIVIILF
jgi:hypothetical protein